MTETLAQLRDRIRPAHTILRLGRTDTADMASEVDGERNIPPAETNADIPTEKAFVVTGANSTLITGPASMWEKAAVKNAGFMYLSGRYVEADTPNRNGAYWTTGDLELGQPTVAGGPLNWLHKEKEVIGALMDSRLVYAREAAADNPTGTHIEALAAVWRFLQPEKAATLARHSEDRQLWLSMECVSQNVQCVTGCGDTFPYKDWMTARHRVCAHLQAGSPRRFVDPIFLGSAVIVPPIQPGWANAQAEVLREAAAVTEANDLGTGALSKAEAEHMVTAILQWANGDAR